MSKYEFENYKSLAESAIMEVLKGNKVVMFQKDGKFHLIVWESYNENE